MSEEIQGIHHITAIAGDPQQNLDFYSGVLGLHLVKLTVNFDDPGTYHLYYGDGLGTPGTILTFFPWPGAPRGQQGSGQVTTTAFSIPEPALGYWVDRLHRLGVSHEGPRTRFDESVVSFIDPDGLVLELVAHRGAEARVPWTHGPVSAEYAIRGFHGLTLSERRAAQTAPLLTEVLGFRLLREAETRFRYQVGSAGAGVLVDVLDLPDAPRGEIAVGTVHHVAWRTPTDEAQQEWRRRIAGRGLNVTPVLDRRYFRSIYFREPGGVLFEIATDPPGFVVDEKPEELGTHLKLPPWLEPMRSQLEQRLPRLRLPGVEQKV